CPIPIILYNVPGRTASNVLPETLARLAHECENIVAVKEAANDIVQAMQMIDRTPDDFLVISGDDILALPMTLAGGAGVISVIGQGFPKEFSDMIRLGLDRQVDKAYELHYKMAPCIDYIFAEGNPAGIKAVFHKLGICQPFVRLPLVGISKELRVKIDAFADNL
nr:dihydrodipicolinate synthase family protein [Flavobacteriaceae bacterium]